MSQDSGGRGAFAGDRGFLHPELTHSATSEEVEELKGHHFDQYLSSNRTAKSA